MVGTRHLYGNLMTRTKFLLDSGALKEVPKWFAVLQKFPPPPCAILHREPYEGIKHDLSKGY